MITTQTADVILGLDPIQWIIVSGFGFLAGWIAIEVFKRTR